MPKTARSHRRTSLLASLALVAAALFVPTVTAAPALAAGDPCGPTGNKIACENSKPGNPPSEWDDFFGAGSDDIQGFSTDISVNVGQRIDFKIDTNASAYTIDIYRTGYYNGDGARKITSINPSVSLPQNQPNCITDPSTELYDCGNWAVSAFWNVPSTAVSGVYIARLHRNDLDASSHITFVVRDDASTSDVVFQTSDTTWQAYNTYGGSDFYQGAGNGRAYKVSYNRPVLTRGHEHGRDFYFSAEYPAVRFLEKNGYDVSYIAGVDTHRRGNVLLNHKTYMSVGHDEYWSGQQRANVEAARDAGVNLMFLSGNEVYWRTRYEASADPSHTAYRTLVSYKETWASSKIDPAAEWTGTWRDPRYAPPAQGGGRPENALTGTMYMVNDVDHPVTVSTEEGKLRLWRSTSLASLASGQTRALAPHTVGYESNEDLDNGFRPAGLVRLSTTTGPTPQYLQDFGNTVKPGTTTHHLTMYKAPSGALVFSAGSVQWTWGLDEVHDTSWAQEPADVRMQQAQVNLLADMSAQPTTLQAGLVAAAKSTDTTGPTVAISSPAAGSQQQNGASVTVTGTASDVGGRVAGIEVSTDAGATWHAATGTASWSYTYVQHGQGAVPIRVRGSDDSANIGATASRDVNVKCTCSIFGATVPAITASDDTSGAELGLRFTPTINGYVSGVRFYKGAGNGGTHTGSLWSTSGQRLATVTFANETATGWQTAAFSEAVEVSAGTSYVVSYSAPQGRYAYQSEAFSYRGLQADPFTVAGGWGANPAGVYANVGSFPTNSHRNSQYYVDVTFTTVDESALGVNNRSPLPGASSVSPTTNVEGRFSKPVVGGSQSITVKAAGQSVAGATSYDATTRTITFDPTAALAPDTVYDVEIKGTDNLGNPVSSGGTWSFRSAKAPTTPGVCPCSLFEDTVTPSVLHADDNDAVTLGVRFAPTVDGKITSVRFFKGPNNTGTHTGALWTVGGTQLATGTFTNESATGWQTLTFDAPVPVSKNVEYVASYRTTVGKYSYTPGDFAANDLSRGPLRVASNSGAYSYAAGFPGAQVGTNYLVDVVFERNAASLSVVQRRPAADATGAARDTTVDLWTSAPLAAGATMQVVRSGQPVAGTTSLGGGQQRLSFTPDQPLPADSLYTVTASGLVSTEGAALPNQTWTFRTDTTADEMLAQTVHGNVLPASEGSDESDAIELGMAFTPTVDGLVSGVRFFKDYRNTGTHVGTLWTSTGTSLGTVTFQNETPSGWQRATFAEPLAVTAGTTYVVSYLAPEGHYAATSGFFAEPRTSGSLTTQPGAARFRYGAGGGFPTSTFGNPSYFVDVEFRSGSQPLGMQSRSPSPDATGVEPGSTVSVGFSEPIGNGHTMALTNAGAALAGTSALSADRRTLTFTPTSPLPLDRDIQVDLTGVVAQDDSSPLGARTWSFRTRAATAISIASRTPATGATGVPRTAPVSVTFDQPVAAGYSMTLTGPGGAVAGSTVRSTDGRTLTLTPTNQLAAGAAHTVSLSGVVSVEGAALGSASWSFTTQAPAALTMTARSPAPGATNVSRSGPVTVTFSGPIANGYAMTPRVGTTAVPGSVTRSSDARTLTFTPSGLMTASATVTVTLTGVVSTDGVALGTQTWSFTTAPRPTLTQTLFTGLTPASTSTNTRAIEVGTHFTPSVAGQLTAVRFYKAPQDTGTHTVAVYRIDGSFLGMLLTTQLTRQTVTGETASGWQTRTLTTPISLTAGTAYVVAYTSPTGRVSQTPNFYTSASYTQGPLTATRALNGRYRYTTGAFPNTVTTGTNYFVDPVFQYLGP